MTSQRNLSPQRYYEHLGRTHRPQYRFDGASQADWQAWSEALRPQVLATLGDAPPTVPLNAELQVEWVEDGVRKQKWLIDVEPQLAATVLIFRPEKADGPLPAILCCHGHGRFGKDAVMGNGDRADLRENIRQHNYDYGLQMAKAGYVTAAIDSRGFGERDDRRKPVFTDKTAGRDPCNLNYLRAGILGRTLLGDDVRDAQRALDLLCEQPYVDGERLGVMGLSFGGTMTVWITLCDSRIKAADVICYSDRFSDFGLRDLNFCGSQITPGLYRLCDVPDLQGLIAPRPLLVEIGIHDDCFLLSSAMSCYREVEKIYSAAGVRDRLELDLFEGGHAWGANRTKDFFGKWL